MKKKLIYRAGIIFILIFTFVVTAFFLLFTPKKNIERMLGASLPWDAQVLEFEDHAGMFGGEYYFSVAMKPNEYEAYTLAVGLYHDPELLTQWPDALSLTPLPTWWTNNTSVNEQTRYVDKPDQSMCVVTQYEDGVMYCRVQVY